MVHNFFTPYQQQAKKKLAPCEIVSALTVIRARGQFLLISLWINNFMVDG